MGEVNIKKVSIEDLPKPEQELTPEEAQQIQGGRAEQSVKAPAQEGKQKRGTPAKEEDAKRGGI